MKDWTGMHAVVTGGSSGIGLATAELLAERGCDVTIVARSRDRLELACEAVASHRKAVSQHFCWVSADVATPEGAQASIADATEMGARPVDLLLNCAGIVVPGCFEALPPEVFERSMDSWRGCVQMARAVVPSMMERKSGQIVNIASVAGFMGIFGYTAYSSAKYAIMGFSEALRSEMHPYGITVSVVCPPDTDTPGFAYECSLRPPETDKVAGNIAPVSPAFVAEAIVKGVERGKYLIVPGFISKFYRFLKSNAAWLFFAITDGDVASARKARGLEQA